MLKYNEVRRLQMRQMLKFSKAPSNLNYIEFKSLAFILRCYLFLLTLRAAPELPEEDLSSFLKNIRIHN